MITDGVGMTVRATEHSNSDGGHGKRWALSLKELFLHLGGPTRGMPACKGSSEVAYISGRLQPLLILKAEKSTRNDQITHLFLCF